MKKLSIIIPVFNEKNNISVVLNAVKKAPTPGFEKEIIVVDDYSTDGTREILKETEGVTLILAERNGGKGAAIKLGLTKVTGDFILFQDADLEYSPEEYKHLLPFVDTSTVVFGSRYLKNNKRNHLSGGARAVNVLFNALFRTAITDVATCYKIFPSDLKEKLSNIRENDFVYDVIQATAVAVRNKKNIREVGISYNPRTYAEGKKLRIKHGLRIVATTLKEGILYFIFR